MIETQLAELFRLRFEPRGISFIRQHEHRLADFVQESRQLAIHRRDAFADINDEQDHLSCRHGCLRLPQDAGWDERVFVRDDAASVHHFKRAATPLGPAMKAVARDARLVADNRPARANQPVEER